MNGMRVLFLLIAPTVSAAVFILLCRLPEEPRFVPISICFLGIIAGAVGNFIDRLLHGYVVDFIYFKPIDFPVFNVADIYVTCSAILMVLLILFYYREDELKAISLFPNKTS